MIDNLVQNLHLLQKADSLVGKLWFDGTARRLARFLFAGLITIFGLAMTNVAGFYALQTSNGPVWAAAIVALADFVLAAIVIWFANSSELDTQMEAALMLRKTSVDAVKADARDFKGTIDALGQDIRDAKATIAGIVQNPLDAAAQTLLIPAAISIVKGLRTKKDQG